MHAKLKSPQSWLTLWDPMGCSLSGSSFHGILQARILEWVAMPCSRGSSWPRDQTHVSYVSCIGRQILPLAPPGKPIYIYIRASQVAQIVKNLPAMQETWIWSLGWEWLPVQYSSLKISMDREAGYWFKCILFNGWVILHCVYVPQLSYPFICWQMYRTVFWTLWEREWGMIWENGIKTWIIS